MKTNITKTSCVRGIITFSEEEKEIFQEAYSLLERVIDLTTFLDNRKDDFDGYLSYGENEVKNFSMLKKLLKYWKA